MRVIRVLTVLAGVVVGTALVSAQGLVSPFAPGVLRPGPGIVNPTEVRFVEPRYTQAAMDARIQGMVVLEAVVQANGTVGDVRVTQSLDSALGLDQQAIDAAKHWLFHPATKDGTAIPVVVTLELVFRLPAFPMPTGTGVRYAVVAKPPQDPIKLPDDDFAKGAYAEDTPGLIVPKATYQGEPKYTSDAMRAKIQGTVEVEAIIGADGSVTKARVSESLDKVYGLDDEALKAVRGWTFKPGTLAGQPVPVYAKIILIFRLH